MKDLCGARHWVLSALAPDGSTSWHEVATSVGVKEVAAWVRERPHLRAAHCKLWALQKRWLYYAAVACSGS